jgi:hypothetical protein
VSNDSADLLYSTVMHKTFDYCSIKFCYFPHKYTQLKFLNLKDTDILFGKQSLSFHNIEKNGLEIHKNYGEAALFFRRLSNSLLIHSVNDLS